MTEPLRRLLSHASVIRRTPRRTLEERYGAGIVTSALEQGLIAADGFAQCDITEKGIYALNNPPRAAMSKPITPPPARLETEPEPDQLESDPKPTTLEAETLEGGPIQEVPVTKPSLSRYEKLVGVFQNAASLLTLNELGRMLRENPKTIRHTITQMLETGEIVSVSLGSSPTSPKAYGFPHLVKVGDQSEDIAPSKETEPRVEQTLEHVDLEAVDAQVMTSDATEWETLESDPTHAMTFPVFVDHQPRTDAKGWLIGPLDSTATPPTNPIDPELEAMNVALTALQPLDDDGRIRTVDWLIKRFNIADYYKARR
jgi:hypothetical protein